MKRMLFLSMVFHLALAVLVLVMPMPSGHGIFRPSVYQVNLVGLPGPSQEAPTPPKPVVEKRPAPKPRIAEKPKKEAVKLPPLEAKPVEPVAPKTEEAPPPKQETASIPSEPTVTAKIDTPDFRYRFYTDLIERKVGSSWSPPPLETGHEPKEAVISFSLLTTGKIEEVRVEKSSGNPFFDQAALRAVYMASPFPPLPRGFQEPALKIYFSFILSPKG